MIERVKLPSLVEGVSRQPASLKESNRPDEQIDLVPHPVLGLMPRPGSEFLAKLSTFVGPGTRWHQTNTREDEQYFVALRPDGVRVWDVLGEEYLVQAPGGYGYLAGVRGGNNLTNPQLWAAGVWDPSVSGYATVTLSNAAGVSPFGSGFTSTKVALPGSGLVIGAVTQLLDGSGGSQDIVYAAGGKVCQSLYVRFPQGTTNTYTFQIALSNPALNATTARTYTYDGTAGTLALLPSYNQTWATSEAGAEYVGDGWFRVFQTLTPLAGSSIVGLNVHALYVFSTPVGATSGAQMEYWVDGARIDLGVQTPPSFLLGLDARYEAVTVKDFTYILNPDMPVQMTGATTTALPTTSKVFYLWVRLGSPKTKYRVRGALVGGSTFDVDTDTWGGPGTFESGEIKTFKAEDIAADLASQLTATTLFNAVLVKDSLIRVTCKSTANDQPSQLVAADSQGNTALVLIYEGVRDTADIPAKFFDGVKLAVGVDTDLATPPYYVVFDTPTPDALGYGDGQIAETNGFGVTTTIDSATMPHGLTRRVDDASGTVTGSAFKRYFAFGPITWDQRLKGDDATNPVPSFVSTTTEPRFIRSLAIVQNRLAVTTRDNVVMTESGVFTNWWRTTVRDSVPGDAFDVAINYPDVAEYDAIVQANGRTFLRAPRVLFELEGDPFFSAQTLSAAPALETQSDSLCKPIAIGGRITLTDASGERFARVKELLQTDARGRLVETDVTAEVQDWLTGRVLEMSASEQLGMMAFTVEAPDLATPSPTIYLNSYYWDGATKYQNAWWKVSFGAGHTVRLASFVGQALYVVVEYGQQTCLERITFDMPRQLSSTYQVLADGRFTLTTANAAFTGTQTVVNLPARPHPSDAFVFVADGSGALDRGDVIAGTLVINESSPTPWQVFFTHGTTLVTEGGWVGRRYRRRFRFPQVRPKEPDNQRGRHSTTSALVQSKHLMLDYRATAELRASVTVQNAAGSPYSYWLTSDTGSGDPPLNTGQWMIPARGRGSRVTVEIDSGAQAAYDARPFVLTSGEWFIEQFAPGRRSFA